MPATIGALRLRLTDAKCRTDPFGPRFRRRSSIDRTHEADDFYATVIPRELSPTTPAA